MYDFRDAFLTVKETSAFFRVSQSYIYYLINHGLLPAIKVGYFWRIPTASLDKFVVDQLKNLQN